MSLLHEFNNCECAVRANPVGVQVQTLNLRVFSERLTKQFGASTAQLVSLEVQKQQRTIVDEQLGQQHGVLHSHLILSQAERVQTRRQLPKGVEVKALRNVHLLQRGLQTDLFLGRNHHSCELERV